LCPFWALGRTVARAADYFWVRNIFPVDSYTFGDRLWRNWPEQCPVFHTLTGHSMVFFSTIRGIKYISTVYEPNPLILREQVVHNVLQQASYFNGDLSYRQCAVRSIGRYIFENVVPWSFTTQPRCSGTEVERRSHALNLSPNDGPETWGTKVLISPEIPRIASIWIYLLGILNKNPSPPNHEEMISDETTMTSKAILSNAGYYKN